MRKPAEHGNVITSIILISSSIYDSLIFHDLLETLIAWIPIILGLFVFDIPIKSLFKDKRDYIIITMISIFSVITLYYNILMLLPYSIFLLAYAGKLYFAMRRMNYIDVVLGILAYSLIYSITLNVDIHLKLEVFVALFLFSLGSEFSVRSFVRKKPIFLTYNILPASLILADWRLAGVLLSIIRIPAVLLSKKIKYIGITESILLASFIIAIETILIFRL